jgi:NitT/TauT family transport system ATP-binding protein
MSTPLISITNLSKAYPKRDGQRRVAVFNDINLTIHKGEFLVLLGPSGCGKSTLLRIVSGLDAQTAGTISYAGGFKPEHINFVFQNFGILPWLTVFQNVELGLIGRNIPAYERVRSVDSILEQLGLLSFKDRLPHELSGGMKQRVGLARAFVTKPDIIFLDEPFSELDFFTAKTLREVLLEMWKTHGTTVVMVSHYIDEAVILADRIAVFSNRPSTIVTVIENTIPRPREYRAKPFFDMEDEVLSHFEK